MFQSSFIESPPIIGIYRGDDGIKERLGGVQHDAAGSQHGQVVDGLHQQGHQDRGQWPATTNAGGPSETESHYVLWWSLIVFVSLISTFYLIIEAKLFNLQCKCWE